MKGEMAEAGMYKVLCKFTPLAQLAEVLGSSQAPLAGPALVLSQAWGSSLPHCWSTAGALVIPHFKAKLFAAFIPLQDPPKNLYQHTLVLLQT